MSADAVALNVPRVVLKPVYESFLGKSENTVARQLRLMENVDPTMGLETYALSQQATDFDDFYSRVHAVGARCLEAAAKIGESLSLNLYEWDEDNRDNPPAA